MVGYSRGYYCNDYDDDYDDDDADDADAGDNGESPLVNGDAADDDNDDGDANGGPHPPKMWSATLEVTTSTSRIINFKFFLLFNIGII